MTEGQAIGFENVNLNEVDPISFDKLPDAVPMQFVVSKAEQGKWETEKGSGECIDFVFTVVNNPNFSGRNFYTRVFPDKEGGKQTSARKLAILRNVTGVTQSGAIEDLLPALVSQRAEFIAPLQTYNNRQEVNLFGAKPIS